MMQGVSLPLTAPVAKIPSVNLFNPRLIRLLLAATLSFPMSAAARNSAAAENVGLPESQRASEAEPERLAQAAGTPALSCPQPAIAQMLPPAPDRSNAPMVVYARSLNAGKLEQGVAEGEVELFRADQYLKTEQIFYHPQTQVVTAPASVEYHDQQIWLRGDDAHYDFLQESGHFANIDYGLTGSSANGSAEFIELIGGQSSRLYRLQYTTCPGESPSWMLSASELQLDHEKGWGEARHAKLEFYGVPILYAPWFTFPIDDRRKSGFLYPNFSNTNDNGIEVGAPWYWNIAPNQDAIIEPRYFINRGLMLSGEYRMLTRRTRGQFEFDYMHDDRDYPDSRHRYKLEHFAQPWRR
jgi:LPS-assembly protein